LLKPRFGGVFFFSIPQSLSNPSASLFDPLRLPAKRFWQSARYPFNQVTHYQLSLKTSLSVMVMSPLPGMAHVPMVKCEITRPTKNSSVRYINNGAIRA
jgi:hypothetical protein